MGWGIGQGRALLTATIEIRAERLRGEVLFPQAWREELNLQGRMGIDALEHIDEVDIGIDALQATGGQQTVDDAHLPSTYFGPAKQPVLAAQGHGANLSFEMIGINGHIGIGEKDFQGGFPLERVLRRLAEGVRWKEEFRRHCLFEPGKELLDQGFSVLAPMRQLGLSD